ncbi:hypothetical protein NRIC_22670 [Enterococcus florum]|uniref:Uncharacterized protein n=1 Tax=Enterococcus florum TaxID=2480627 RepID=A0A4P5P9V1_9ENTE|nr:hypothetical protein [Enterococcus florum]GCF94376.1 hypothetical protein NRIC_22670 [Enterococcus florum]
MIRELKNNFMQAALGSTLWITALTSLFYRQQMIPLSFVWKLFSIGGLLGFIFGVSYPYLWNYSTFQARTNILISSVLNTLGGFLALYLFSSYLFSIVRPYFFPILGLTLIGHTLGFYFYSRYQQQRLAKELNQIKK